MRTTRPAYLNMFDSIIVIIFGILLVSFMHFRICYMSVLISRGLAVALLPVRGILSVSIRFIVDSKLGKARGLFLVWFNLLKPTGHVIHQQFNIQQLYVLPTLYLCVLYLSENKQRLVPLTA
jgi:hypothetical protein